MAKQKAQTSSRKQEKTVTPQAELAYQFPFELAFKAMTYAGMSLPKIRETFSKMHLVIASDIDPCAMSKFRKWRNAAKKLHPNFEIDYDTVETEKLDPVFTWAQNYALSPRLPQVMYVRNIINECLDIRHQGMVDVLLYLNKKTPEEISDILKRYNRASPIRWEAADIRFYRDFFWDTSHMRARDWRHYVSQEDRKNVAPHYLRSLSVASLEDERQGELDLLASVDLPSLRTPEEQNQDLLDKSYVLSSKQHGFALKNNGAFPNAAARQDYLAATSSFVKLKGCYNEGIASDSEESTRKMRAAIDNVTVKLGYDPSGTEVLPADTIQGTISDNEDTTQCDFVIQAEENNFAGFDGSDPYPSEYASEDDMEDLVPRNRKQPGQKDKGPR